jgi:hypothetical protein
MKLPRQFTGKVDQTARPSTKCKACKRQGIMIREKGSLVRRCGFCGVVQ